MKKNIYIFILLVLCIGRTSFSSDLSPKKGFKNSLIEKWENTKNYMHDLYEKHKKKFWVAGGIIGTGILYGATQYLTNKYNARSLVKDTQPAPLKSLSPSSYTNERMKLEKEIERLANQRTALHNSINKNQKEKENEYYNTKRLYEEVEDMQNEGPYKKIVHKHKGGSPFVSVDKDFPRSNEFEDLKKKSIESRQAFDSQVKDHSDYDSITQNNPYESLINPKTVKIFYGEQSKKDSGKFADFLEEYRDFYLKKYPPKNGPQVLAKLKKNYLDARRHDPLYNEYIKINDLLETKKEKLDQLRTKRG